MHSTLCVSLKTYFFIFFRVGNSKFFFRPNFWMRWNVGTCTFNIMRFIGNALFRVAYPELDFDPTFEWDETYYPTQKLGQNSTQGIPLKNYTFSFKRFIFHKMNPFQYKHIKTKRATVFNQTHKAHKCGI